MSDEKDSCEPPAATPKKECDTAVGDDDDFKLETAPFDPRFPNMNQTKHCTMSFVDYKRCIKLRGEDYEPCQYFKRVYTSMCPFSWVDKWEDQIEKGIFPVQI